MEGTNDRTSSRSCDQDPPRHCGALHVLQKEGGRERTLTKLGHPHLSTVAVLPLSSLSLFERDITVFSFECHVLSDVIFSSKKTGWPQRHSSTLAKVVARAIYVQIERVVQHQVQLSNA